MDIRKAFGLLQQIGKSLMLPVSVLPVAGILLGVGSAKFTWLPEGLSKIMAQSGGAIFGNLPIIFAIGVALGLTGNDGVSALAAVVGYVVLLGAMGVMASVQGLKTTSIMGIDSLDTGVFGGILIGAVAAWLFNRYFRIKLPPYLGFFSGKRFVPIITSFAAIALGFILSFIWPPIQDRIQAFADYAAYSNPTLAVFLYGVVERMLLPFGLHHIWNVPFFFQIGSYTVPGTTQVVHGDITRFFKGDPTAGILAGGYLFKMWGLPAAAIAIWHAARPERRVEIGSIMISAALTSFLTGITEPIEFSFMFVAPLLYALHALLAGIAFLTMQLLGAHLGFTFSQGFIDYALYYTLDQKPWLVLVLGPIYALIYYGVFRGAIAMFDLKTPGREDVAEGAVAADLGGDSLAGSVLAALGGAANLTSLDACITRLRVGLADMAKADPARLKALGAAGVVTVGNGLQAIFGTMSENLKTDIEQILKSGGAALSAPVAKVEAKAPVTVSPMAMDRAQRRLAALGGPDNVVEVEAIACTRLRVVLKTPVPDFPDPHMVIKPEVLHLIVGTTCEEDAVALKSQLRQPARV